MRKIQWYKERSTITSSIFILFLITFGLLAITIGSYFSPWSYKNCSHSNDCDDSNPCTKDICKNFLCEYSLIENATCSDTGMCESDQICNSTCQCTDNLILSDFTSNTCHTSLCELDEIIGITSNASSFLLPGNITTYSNIDSIKVGPDVQLSNQRFGSAVVSCNDLVFVGSGGRNSMSGSVYVYETVIDNLVLMADQVQILLGPTASNLGFSLSISDNCTFLIAGAPDLDPSNHGGFIIYKKNETSSSTQYDLFQTVTASSTNDLGYSIKISNNSDLTIISGDPQGNNAKVFDFDGGTNQWVLVQTIVGNDTSSNNKFGTSVDILEDLAIIGAIKKSSIGSAYIFKRNGSGATWVNTQILIGSDRQNGDDFGSCVALYEDYALVGAVSASRLGTSSGGAYLYLNPASSYTEIDAFFPISLGNTAEFGHACSFNDEGLSIIGSPGYDTTSKNNAGIAIVYNIINNQLNEYYRLTEINTVINGQIGTSVFISNDLTIAGAPTYSIGGTASGIILLRHISVPVDMNISVDCLTYFPTINTFRLWCEGNLTSEFSPGIYFLTVDGSSLPFNSSAVIHTWHTFSAYGTTDSGNSIISVLNPQISLNNVFTAYISTYGSTDITIVVSSIRKITSKVMFF